MNAKYLLFAIMMIAPSVAFGAMPYRAATRSRPSNVNVIENMRPTAASHSFYVGGGYTFSMWDGVADTDVRVSGKNTSSFDVVAGYRVADWFRTELDYTRTDARWSGFKLHGDTVMVNALFDARLNSLYRIINRQTIVPYVGVGAGASFNSASDVHISDDVSATFAALAGFSVEMGDRFMVDLGYRYLYMMSPKFDAVSGLNPTANQFRAGFRVNF